MHFAKAIVVLASMLAARHGLNIGMAGVLDDLRAPVGARGGNGHDPARRVCLRCGRSFASGWHGHRICSACTPLIAGGSLDGESALCVGVEGCLQRR